MVDATVGHGGHSVLFGRQLGPKAKIVGLDLDEKSIQRAHLKLSEVPCQVVLVRENFANIAAVLQKQRIERVDFILADFGMCSAQIADDRYGLSFSKDMPLDMRIDQRLTTTAADIINSYSEKQLADMIYEYGQDRASRRIARYIVAERRKERISTTGQLATVVARALHRPGKKTSRRIHPATRTFQALRIAVNRELDNIERLLEDAPKLLKTGGRIALISFHSLEDRLVKWNLKNNEKKQIYRVLTKKPLTADQEEKKANPRARSAKLRIAERI